MPALIFADSPTLYMHSSRNYTGRLPFLKSVGCKDKLYIFNGSLDLNQNTMLKSKGHKVSHSICFLSHVRHVSNGKRNTVP